MSGEPSFVWYHDLDWTLADDSSSARAELRLSDGTQVKFAIQSPDQLAGMINQLERAL